MRSKWPSHGQCHSKKLAIFILRRVMNLPATAIATEIGCSSKWITRVVNECDDTIIHNSHDRALLFQLLCNLTDEFPDACFADYRLPLSHSTTIAIQNLKTAKASADRLRRSYYLIIEG